MGFAGIDIERVFGISKQFGNDVSSSGASRQYLRAGNFEIELLCRISSTNEHTVEYVNNAACLGFL